MVRVMITVMVEKLRRQSAWPAVASPARLTEDHAEQRSRVVAEPIDLARRPSCSTRMPMSSCVAYAPHDIGRWAARLSTPTYRKTADFEDGQYRDSPIFRTKPRICWPGILRYSEIHWVSNRDLSDSLGSGRKNASAPAAGLETMTLKHYQHHAQFR